MKIKTLPLKSDRNGADNQAGISSHTVQVEC